MFYGLPVSGIAQTNQWSVQNSGVTSHLFSVCFVNEATGYCAGDSGVIIKTTNGGSHWFRLDSPTTKALSSIVFTDSNTGWIAGNQGNIFKTTNSGMDWFQQNSKTSLDISSIFFLNERLGWGVTLTGNPVYLITTNGGALWDTVMRIGFPINSIMFIDSLSGFSSGGRFDWLGFVNYSDNGGWNWTNPQSVDLEIMFDVVYLNKSFGITVGGDHDFFGSLAYQTFDGGKSWLRQSITDSVPSPLTSIALIDSQHAWVCGYGKIYKVDPSVQSWELQSDTLSRWTWYDNAFVHADLGWFAGANGKILYYNKSSVSVNDRENQVRSFKLHQNFPNPFNPVTTIRCLIHENVIAELAIYNVLGQRVKTLYSGRLTPGYHSWIWDGTNDRSKAVAGGIYIYQLKINHHSVQSRKMILLK